MIENIDAMISSWLSSHCGLIYAGERLGFEVVTPDFRIDLLHSHAKGMLMGFHFWVDLFCPHPLIPLSHHLPGFEQDYDNY